MSSKFLTVIRSNASFVLNGVLPKLLSGKADFRRALMFCLNYRRRGIASLFVSGYPATLHQDLQRSGAAFAAYLPSIKEANKATSKSAPFFDAIACEDMTTARAIARNSRAALNAEEEYEDDFLYVTFLMKRFFYQTPAADLQATLDRYRDVLEGAEDHRFSICESFLLNRNDLFEASLEKLIQQRDEHYRQGMESESILEEEWATEGKLFVEGLALLRLARAHGFSIQENYLFIPSIALEPARISIDPDGWRTPGD